MIKHFIFQKVLMVACCIYLGLSLNAETSPVRTYDETLSLHDGWKQIRKESGQNKSGYWIGYMISKEMKACSFMGCFDGKNRKKESLLELIYHVKPEIDIYSKFHFDGSIHGSFELKDRDETIVKKDVAILFYYPEDVKKDISLTDIKTSNMELYANLEGKPLYWLGKKTNEESFQFLQGLFYKMEKNSHLQDEMLPVMAIHESDNVLPFLKDLVFSNQHDELRKDAVFWIGQQEDADVLPVLKKVASEDKSIKVRKQAVFAVQCVDSEDATKLLIHLAKKGDPYKIQKEAIFWLGQKASDIATKSLKEIVYSEEKTEIQKQAVFALSEQHDISALIEIANTHPNPKVRKQAIFWLGDSGDERALDALIEMVERTI